MVNDQLRALRALVDKLEQFAFAIPSQSWPEVFDALLDGWEMAMQTSRAGLAQSDSSGEGALGC
jgi:hypothetical protein